MKKHLPAGKKLFGKRALVLLLACAAVLALAGTALACGRHGGKNQATAAVCTAEGCETAGRHVHDGAVYCGYAHAGGVCDGKCLALCTAEGCATAGRHSHGGVTCCGNHHEDGFCAGTCAAASGGSHHGSHH